MKQTKYYAEGYNWQGKPMRIVELPDGSFDAVSIDSTKFDVPALFSRKIEIINMLNNGKQYPDSVCWHGGFPTACIFTVKRVLI